MGDFLKSITTPKPVDGTDEVEPSGEYYRPVWLNTRPPTFDIRGDSVLFNISYPNALLIIGACRFFSAFWILTNYMTYIVEGENLRDVLRSLGDRKARALYLFDESVHKSWDKDKGRILRVQPVLVPFEDAFKKAAGTFEFSYVAPARAEPQPS